MANSHEETYKKIIKKGGGERESIVPQTLLCIKKETFLGRGATSINGSVNPTVWLCVCGCVSRLGSMKSEL